MSKYSNEFKLEVVQYYLNEKSSYMATSKHFNMLERSSIQKWVRKYQEHGVAGLTKPEKSSYSGEFKQNVVEYMHTNHLSLSEATYHFNLGHHSVVCKWERIYNEKGPQGLYKEQRGRLKNMSSKPKKKKLDKDVEEDLIAENQRLRMENEYLKKLNALVQERIKRENRKK